MDTENLPFVIIIISMALIIFYLLYKRKIYKQPIQPVKLDYENDIIFLNYLIKHKIKQTEVFILNPMRVANKTILNDGDYEKYRDRIVTDVFLSLSPIYRNILNKYFVDQALLTYIAEIISLELTGIIVEKNFSGFFVKKPSTE